MSDLAVGDAVVYRSHPGAVPEDGVVTKLSTDPTLVFVRYVGQHPGADGKATRVSDLTRLGAVERVDRYSIQVDGFTVTANEDQEARIRAMDDEARSRFRTIMGDGRG